MLGRTTVSRAVTGSLKNRHTFSSKKTPSVMTTAERQDAIREANKMMKGYVETRILAKQGKLRRRKASEETQSASKIQLSLLISLAAAFIARYDMLTN